MERKKPLPFPANCPDAADIFEGFGHKELMILLVSVVVALIAGLSLWSNCGEVVAVITAFSIVSITFLVTKRNPQQESLVDQIVQVVRYYRSQKKFEYEYYNIYED